MNQQKRLAQAMRQGLQAAGEFYRVAAAGLKQETATRLAKAIHEGASVGVQFDVVGRTAVIAVLTMPDGERIEVARQDL